MGNYSRNTATSVRQLGAIAQCLEWWGNCIGNNKEGNRDKNIEKRWVKHDNKKRNISPTSPIIG